MKITQIAAATLKPGADQYFILRTLGTKLVPHITELVESFIQSGGSKVLAQDVVLNMLNNLMAGKIEITPSNQLAFAILCELLQREAEKLPAEMSNTTQAKHLAVLFRCYVEIALEKSVQIAEA